MNKHKPTNPLTLLLRPLPLFLTAALLRLSLLLYGTWQDRNSSVKYTDVDYLVFTDAARFVLQPQHRQATSTASSSPSSSSSSSSSSAFQGPYTRETYRYTPLLAWLLLPTTSIFIAGKILFALSDLLAGYLLLRILRTRKETVASASHASAYAALWLWNPMVAAISTRGSSEGLLAVLTLAVLWAVETRRVTMAGLVLGLAVHFKIYPFIYAPAIVWWMDDEHMRRQVKPTRHSPSLISSVVGFCSPDRLWLAFISLATFMGLNLLMYSIYGEPFLVHTYLHHITRIDHRHNFSPYNMLLYQNSALPSNPSLRIESLAFVPQLLLSCLLIPLAMAKTDLAASMMAQTFAFVTFNKVCTSQYFLWYMVFLPLILPGSSFLRKPALGIAALGLWIASQAAWLHQAYQLEFLGRSTFFPGMWLASLAFFLVNCWILAIIIADGTAGKDAGRKSHLE
ncbi:hypothetical protein L249_7842 [Ophiocordyceps polyrhachis-furcata BCC 54312]|uniref:GPI mannosyltransferase 1 n=1 Tax=Ophiocordyceps polyrhachis-furcata BCC 54312 TaxID=1330021 RepID=A0A367L0U9_9HYPO|nr:hypothetical protein L249_7842 [Ophiocordyceps polyrhachis-furcata BCC 54312]